MFANPLKVTIDGYNFNYYREGKGETVLFVHGITTYSFIWTDLLPYFINNYEVVLIDLLGCGSSDAALDTNISLKNQAHYIKRFCDEIKIKNIHLVCHDVGGGVGQILTVNYPELVQDLVLLNTIAYNFWPVQPIITMRTPIIRQLAMATLDFGMMELIVKRGVYHKSKLTKDKLVQFLKPLKRAEGRKAFLHFAKCLDNKNLTEIETDLQELPVPVLIVRGNADVYLSAGISEKLYSEIPNCKLVNLKTAGHFLQIDEPELVSHEVLNFIE